MVFSRAICDSGTMQMTPEDLRPELRDPTVKGVAVAFLDLVAWRARMVAELREEMDAPGFNVMHANVLLHVFTFALFDPSGTRAAEVVDNLRAPRRTIRDALAMLERLDLVVKEGSAYYPTAAAAETVFNSRFDARFRLVAKMCDAFTEYRRAVGRITP